jgi:hypothetical protein
MIKADKIEKSILVFLVKKFCLEGICPGLFLH